jgi:starch phosphorylase
VDKTRLKKNENMGKDNEIIKPIYSFLPKDIDGFDSLVELALDLQWAWSHADDEIWEQLDSALWDRTHNPWVVLQTVSRTQFEKVMSDPKFRDKVNDLIASKKQSQKDSAWFQQNYDESSLNCVAYFSLEFMLSEALPIYSGGLGNVAGDQLKTASDLGVPVIGIGLLYQQGYFHQEIDKDGNQQSLYPYNDPGQLPITPLRQPNGEWLRLEIALPAFTLWLRVWQVQVGKVKLYLLDTNDAANFPVHRGITSELYGGGSELRLKQEMVLGLGGWRLLQALGIHPEVCHLNEGHAALAILERAYSFMKENDQSFEVALAATRVGNLFTTHTAVEAGFDCFSPSLIEQYLGGYAEHKLGISHQQLLALGRKNPNDLNEAFNMAYLAIRGSGAVNAVSKLHGKVSRHLFEPLFPHWQTNEIPIGHITNGVHMPTWDSKESDEIWTESCGKDRWLGLSNTLEKDIRNVSDERLWQMRTNANKVLLEFARDHFLKQLQSTGHSSESFERAKHIFDPNVLTLGFARRFASYKRPNLLLHDPERLLRILTNPQFPVQLLLSGKAHPADNIGKDLIKQWVTFIRQNYTHSPIIFLVDYDMHVAEHLVQGVDVWINTPRRPWEACGTSGMKILVNGGINLSVLDGWWAEAYKPELGWAIGDGNEHGDDANWDAIEAEQLYTILEQEVIPEFYNRNEKGIPTQWVSRMRESMAQLTPRFSADRSVREYTEQHYIPAAKAYCERSTKKVEKAEHIVDWMNILYQNWNTMYFGERFVTTIANQHTFTIHLILQSIDPNAIQVELFANGVNDELPCIIKMMHREYIGGLNNEHIYSSIVSTNRAASDFTARVIPYFETVAVPLEINLILWEK